MLKIEFDSEKRDNPRHYQLELYEKAKKGNIIAVLATGLGKTLIATLVLKHMASLEPDDLNLVIFD